MEMRSTLLRRGGGAAGAILLAVLAAGCSGKSPPATTAEAELQTVRGAVPLTLPPNYTLRPPREGGEVAVEHGEAAERILGRRWTAARAEPSTQAAAAPRGPVTATDAMRQQLGVSEALPDIRKLIAEEARGIELSGPYPVEALLCWPRSPGGAGGGCGDLPPTVRPPEGTPLHSGGARPEIERRKPGLGGFF